MFLTGREVRGVGLEFQPALAADVCEMCSDGTGFLVPPPLATVSTF
jgi:hypothetical protein